MTVPKTLDALADINGLGPAKIEKYGQSLLDALHAPVEEE
jgi:hypothetical protein